MGFVQSQKEKEKKAESGEKTGFKSEVILIASLLSRRNLILYTDFYAQRRYCLFSTESETNDNSQGQEGGLPWNCCCKPARLYFCSPGAERGDGVGGRRWGPGQAER